MIAVTRNTCIPDRKEFDHRKAVQALWPQVDELYNYCNKHRVPFVGAVISHDDKMITSFQSVQTLGGDIIPRVLPHMVLISHLTNGGDDKKGSFINVMRATTLAYLNGESVASMVRDSDADCDGDTTEHFSLSRHVRRVLTSKIDALAERFNALDIPYLITATIDNDDDEYNQYSCFRDLPLERCYRHSCFNLACDFADGGMELGALSLPTRPQFLIADLYNFANINVKGALPGETPPDGADKDDTTIH